MKTRLRFTAIILFSFLLISTLTAEPRKIKAQTTGEALSGQEQISSETAQNEAARQELEARIEERNQELKKLNQELAETEEKLKNTKTERSGLERQLGSIKNNINQLSLSIQTDKVTIQKLTLEIDSLKYDIQDIDLDMEKKKTGVIELLRRLHHNSQNNLITILLKGDSLAENILEANALADTSSQLAVEVEGLNNLKETKIQKVDDISNKKSEISLRSKNLENRKVIIEDQKSEQETILANTKNKETAYEQQLAELEKKQEEIAAEISVFEEELKAKFDITLLPSKRPGVLEWPIPLKKNGGVGIITQHMGEVSNLYRGKPHNGLDIGAPLGTPVFAAEDGVVMASDNNDRSSWQKYQYGKYVLIEHENKFATLYAHLSKYVVSKGQTVKRGELIGYSGNTGYSTGPHLHFGLYWATSILMKSIPPATGLVPVGVVLDPEDYL